MPARKTETLSFNGNLDIRQADTLMDQLKKALTGNSNIIIDLENAEDIDFAIIQLLYSFKKSMTDAKRKVRIESLNSKISDKIRLCDFQDLLEVD